MEKAQRPYKDGIEKGFKGSPQCNQSQYYVHDQYLEVTDQKAKHGVKVVYCRVSSANQRKDLLSQKAAAGKSIDEKLEDIGSGLNYKRRQFLFLMERVERGEIAEIVIAHKDRLVRFGFEWFEKFCYDHGTSITVMNADSLSAEAEMTKDLLSMIHCFSSRLYGLRKNKKKITEMAKEHENSETADGDH